MKKPLHEVLTILDTSPASGEIIPRRAWRDFFPQMPQKPYPYIDYLKACDRIGKDPLSEAEFERLLEEAHA
jgi:hypothetical protein